ncbi:MAG: gamma-glutamyl-gamma-aminobutyrate hydrolase family protein [Myxococcota bacterium]
MRLIFVDAYDSFTYNLVHGLQLAGPRVQVVRCDEVDPGSLRAADAVVLGPGPGEPHEAGCFIEAVHELLGRVPLLGVCLGHQALGIALGARLRRHEPVHGHATPVIHDGTGLFAGLPPRAPMTRYHSLVIDDLPPSLRACAFSDDQAIMGVAHTEHPAWGVQFHPESVLSGPAGLGLLARFVSLASAWHRQPSSPITPGRASSAIR